MSTTRLSPSGPREELSSTLSIQRSDLVTDVPVTLVTDEPGFYHVLGFLNTHSPAEPVYQGQFNLELIYADPTGPQVKFLGYGYPFTDTQSTAEAYVQAIGGLSYRVRFEGDPDMTGVSYDFELSVLKLAPNW